MKKIIIISVSSLICLIVLISAYLIIISREKAKAFEQYLRDTKASTVRIEIKYNSFLPDKTSKIYELTEKDAKEFFDCLKLKVPLSRKHCKCVANYIINIYSKDKHIDRFTIHNDNNIRCAKFNVGNITILPESKAMLKSFFAKHGIPKLK